MSYDSPFKMRAWDGTKMVTVQTLCHNTGGALWYGAGNQFGWAWVNPESTEWNKDNPKPGDADICPVMRWTGLKDKNGVDIYEDDILSYRGGEAYLAIQYVEEYARFGGIMVMQDGEEPENDSFVWFDDHGMPNKTEVLGNIHANSDLLKT